jgi:hypothetical protein
MVPADKTVVPLCNTTAIKSIGTMKEDGTQRFRFLLPRRVPGCTVWTSLFRCTDRSGSLEGLPQHSAAQNFVDNHTVTEYRLATTGRCCGR